MPSIISASDGGLKRKFVFLHNLSVFISIAYISMVGFALYLMLQPSDLLIILFEFL